MPISAPGNSRPAAEGGFTLVELMVVLTVIGLASAAAVLAMPDPRGRLVDEGARFAACWKSPRTPRSPRRCTGVSRARQTAQMIAAAIKTAARKTAAIR